MPVKRIFIAIDISDEARRRAADHIEKMGELAKCVRVSWERPEKLHVTLKFLGNVEDELIDRISDGVAAIAGRFAPFEMAVAETGVFPRGKQPRVLWLGIENTDHSLREIASQVDSRISRLGFEKEKRSFSPHLTIARIREPQKAKRLAESHLQSRFGRVEFKVSELMVYESVLKPTGSVYNVLSKHSLKAA